MGLSRRQFTTELKLAAGVSPRARQCVSGPGETALGARLARRFIFDLDRGGVRKSAQPKKPTRTPKEWQSAPCRLPSFVLRPLSW
jgi:hypothetical protein